MVFKNGVILVPRRLRQEVCCEFKDSIDYREMLSQKNYRINKNYALPFKTYFKVSYQIPSSKIIDL